MQTIIHVFLPSFVENGKAEVTKPVAWYSSRKRLVFGPFLRSPWSDLAKKYLFTFPFPIPLPSFVQIRPDSENTIISENVSQTHNKIGVKPVGFSPTTKHKFVAKTLESAFCWNYLLIRTFLLPTFFF